MSKDFNSVAEWRALSDDDKIEAILEYHREFRNFAVLFENGRVYYATYDGGSSKLDIDAYDEAEFITEFEYSLLEEFEDYEETEQPKEPT